MSIELRIEEKKSRKTECYLYVLAELCVILVLCKLRLVFLVTTHSSILIHTIAQYTHKHSLTHSYMEE